jgi:hypothetical protein
MKDWPGEAINDVIHILTPAFVKQRYESGVLLNNFRITISTSTRLGGECNQKQRRYYGQPWQCVPIDRTG